MKQCPRYGSINIAEVIDLDKIANAFGNIRSISNYALTSLDDMIFSIEELDKEIKSLWNLVDEKSA